jgi:hypothetical protein
MCNNSDISSKAKVGCSSGKLEPSHPTVYHKQMISNCGRRKLAGITPTIASDVVLIML